MVESKQTRTNSLQKLIRNQDGTETPYQIDFQLKCTESPTSDNAEYVSFSLSDDHFTQLSSRIGGKPLLLTVMVVPDTTNGWFEVFPHEDTDKHHSTRLKYWRKLSGS